MRRRRHLRTLGGLLAVSIGGLTYGCNALPPRGLKPPTLIFRELSIKDASLEQVRFTLIIDANNPNDVDLPIRELNCVLELGGREIARGAARESAFVLPGAGSREVPLDFSARTGEILSVLRRLPESQGASIAYRLIGSARWGDSPFSIPFERQGSIDPLRSLRRLLPGRSPGN